MTDDGTPDWMREYYDGDVPSIIEDPSGPIAIDGMESITTDRISPADDGQLFDAYVAGFMKSGEGFNAEHPHAFNEEKIREAIREDFEAWLAEEL